MKYLKILTPILVFLFTLNSCVVERPREYVEACFTVQGTAPFVVDDPITFVNCSRYAYEYSWDFGDGYTSNQRNPTHSYTQAGTYQVRLTAYGEYSNEYETFTHNVTVDGSTDLDLLVLYFGDDVVSNCEVTLYRSLVDWQTFSNPVQNLTLITNTNGLVLFRGLDPIQYWIDAYKKIDDDYYWSNESTTFIETDYLLDNQVNYYKVYVLEETTLKKSDRKNLVIKSLVPSSKEEHERIIEANKNK